MRGLVECVCGKCQPFRLVYRTEGPQGTLPLGKKLIERLEEALDNYGGTEVGQKMARLSTEEEGKIEDGA